MNDVVCDLFLCHAAEDKDEVATRLANALREHGVSVWDGEFSLKFGDGLRQAIDRGLSRSRFGVVVLSPKFFANCWPQEELDALATREVGGKKVILPSGTRLPSTTCATFLLPWPSALRLAPARE